MKKFYFLALTFLALSLTLVSCKDDTKEEETDHTKFPYSSLSPEAQKEKLAGEAKAMIQKMEGLADTKGLELLKSFQELCEIDTPELPNTENPEEIIYIKDFYGTYTWNFDTESWMMSEEVTDKLTFILPAKRGGTTNDGKIEVTGKATDLVLNGKYELPEELDAVLKVGTSIVGNIGVKHTGMTTEKLPSHVSVRFTIDAYHLTMHATKGTPSTSTFELKKGDEVLMSGDAKLNGDLDKVVNEVDGEVIGEGNVTVSLMNNLLIYGTIDFVKMEKERDAVEEKYYDDLYDYPTTTVEGKAYSEISKKMSGELASVFNNNSNLNLVSRSDKAKIATLRELSKKTGSHDFQFNGQEISVERYDELPAFKFNDNTTVEAEVYFGDGFSTVISQWESFLEKLNK